MIQIKHGKTPLTHRLEATIVKMSTLCVVTQWFSAISIKFPIAFYPTNKTVILKFIRKTKLPESLSSLGKKEPGGHYSSFLLQNISQSYDNFRKSRSAEKEARHQEHTMEKGQSVSSTVLEKLGMCLKRIKLNLCLTLHTKINLKMSKHKTWTPKTPTGKNMGKLYFYDIV